MGGACDEDPARDEVPSGEGSEEQSALRIPRAAAAARATVSPKGETWAAPFRTPSS